ncbi:hypothetical protein [Parvimonas micra]
MSNAKNKIKKEELLKFLKFSYFGNLKDPIEATSNRAYRDMCRTIKFNGLSEKNRLKLRKKVKDDFKTEIDNLTSKIQGDFDKWHEQLCKKIIDEYKKSKIQLSYGQAQKWVNMTIKYLYILEVEGYTFDSVFENLHIPIDNYVFDAVEKELGIKRPVDAWSKLDKKEYLKYQEDIRGELRKKNISPLIWEFENWLKEAQEDKKADKK